MGTELQPTIIMIDNVHNFTKHINYYTFLAFTTNFAAFVFTLRADKIVPNPSLALAVHSAKVSAAAW